jgi:hypothetical protein
MGIVMVLLFLVGLGWIVFTQLMARQQVTVSLPAGAAATRQLVAASFGGSWSRVDGRGADNFRPRLRYRAPVISVDYQETQLGTCEVHIWCSAFSTKYGAMNHAQLVWRKKAALARRLAEGAGPGQPRPVAGPAAEPAPGVAGSGRPASDPLAGG